MYIDKYGNSVRVFPSRPKPASKQTTVVLRSHFIGPLAPNEVRAYNPDDTFDSYPPRNSNLSSSQTLEINTSGSGFILDPTVDFKGAWQNQPSLFNLGGIRWASSGTSEADTSSNSQGISKHDLFEVLAAAGLSVTTAGAAIALLKKYGETTVYAAEHEEDSVGADPSSLMDMNGNGSFNSDNNGGLISKIGQELFGEQLGDGDINADDLVELGSISRRKLQHEFSHAGDFGIKGNPNNQTLDEFNTALHKAVNEVSKPINGSYRGVPVTHYYNSETGTDVMVYRDGSLAGSWKLSSQQVENLLRNGNVQ